MQIAGRHAGALPWETAMKPLRRVASPTAVPRDRRAAGVDVFDGPLAACLADIEDALRRAIVQVGDVSSIAVLIEVSLPALKRRVDAGDALQPAWGAIPRAPVGPVRIAAGAARAPRRGPGPLVTLVIVYRS